jgi:hypothetical protein
LVGLGALLWATLPASAETIGLHCTSQTGGTRELTVNLTAGTVTYGVYVSPAKITATSIDWSYSINGGSYGEDNHIDRSTGFMTSAQYNHFYHTEKTVQLQCQKTQGF